MCPRLAASPRSPTGYLLIVFVGMKLTAQIDGDNEQDIEILFGPAAFAKALLTNELFPSLAKRVWPAGA